MSQDPNEDDNTVNEEYRKLYDEFVNALRDRNAGRDNSSWFSEDDLVDIFDYAGDIGKDYVRAEALLWGARVFPDSEILRERRGVFYSDVLTDEDVAQFTSDNGGAHTFLSALLDLRSRGLDGDAARKELEKLIRQYNNLDDEESIQFVNLAADTENLEWLMENLEALKRRVRFRDTLLYEIGMEATHRNYSEYALRVFAELVEMSPYNVTFWCAQARAQYEAGLLIQARESVDMALAISPDNIEATRVNARLLAASLLPGFREELGMLNNRYADDMEIAEAYAEAIYRTSSANAPEYEFSVAELKHLLDSFPQSSEITANYIALAPISASAALLDEMWKQSDPRSRRREWREWAAAFLKNGAVDGALALCSAVVRNLNGLADIRFEIEMKASLCLLTKRWTEVEETAELFQNLVGGLSPQVSVALLYAQMRLHKYSKAQATARMLKSPRFSTFARICSDTYSPLLSALSVKGCNWLSEQFDTDFFTRNPKKADKFDPLKLFGGN